MNDYSRLAWELAQHARFETPPEGGVEAELGTFTVATSITARGNTTSEARQNLARKLDFQFASEQVAELLRYQEIERAARELLVALGNTEDGAGEVAGKLRIALRPR